MTSKGEGQYAQEKFQAGNRRILDFRINLRGYALAGESAHGIFVSNWYGER